LRDRNVEFDVIEYLKQPPSRETLMQFLDLLPNEPADLVRKDKNFKQLGLNADDYVTREAVVDLLLQHPVLMQRPVIIRGERAVIARPSDTVNDLLD
jgi:arsenate reductase (glutaredoxin)